MAKQVQVSQSTFTGQEILFRRCEGRKDFTGGPNHFAPIAELCEPAALARRIAGELGLHAFGCKK